MSNSLPRLVNLTPEEVSRRLAAGEITLIDVREPNEWAAGHIAGAMPLPLSTLAGRLDDIPADKPVVLYCAAGGRSARAVAYCQANGLAVDSHLAGGIGAWVAARLPVSRD